MAVINLWPFGRSEHVQSEHDNFEQLVQPHLNRLYKLAYRFTGHRDDAEDLVQDVLLKLYPRLQEMQKIEMLGPWLSRVLYRQFIDKLRSQQRSPVQFTDEEQSYYESQADSAQLPAELFESRLTQEALQQALDELSEDMRILVMLHDVEGYTLQEIHQMLDVPVGTLKSRLSRARTKLKEILSQMELFSEAVRVNG